MKTNDNLVNGRLMFPSLTVHPSIDDWGRIPQPCRQKYLQCMSHPSFPPRPCELYNLIYLLSRVEWFQTVGREGPTVPSQPLDRVKHTCPVSAAVGVDRRRSEDPTEATGVLLCNGDYFKK